MNTTKLLPFPSKFKSLTITNPMDVYQAFTEAENMPKIHTIIIDSVTFLMDMFESVYVIGASDTMKMWGEYQQFFKNLMQQHVAKSTKNVIFTAHTLNVLNENEMVVECKVPIKGALKNQGLEALLNSAAA